MDALSTAYDFVGLERIEDEDTIAAVPRRPSTYSIATLYDGLEAYAAVYVAVQR